MHNISSPALPVEGVLIQPKITGYRQLTQDEADAMNKVKLHAKVIGELIEELRGMPGLDQRWVSIGATDLQRGFMAVVRGIAQPTTF
jgi:hypothetical protein